MIELQNLSAGYAGHEVLHDISLTFQPGKVLALLGPNGCGKSTLLRAALGLQPKSGGRVLFDGVEAGGLTSRQIAQKAAYLAQSRSVPDITAYRLVLHGRFPYLSFPRRYRREDYAAAERALRWADAADLAGSAVQELSGGQRQRVYLAMMLAQGTQTVLLDEPTTYLDIRHQLDVMAMARRLAQEGKAVVLVVHDLCLAMPAADEVAVLDGGRVIADGTPDAVYASGALERVFGVTLRRIQTETGKRYFYGC